MSALEETGAELRFARSLTGLGEGWRSWGNTGLVFISTLPRALLVEAGNGVSDAVPRAGAGLVQEHGMGRLFPWDSQQLRASRAKQPGGHVLL